MKVTDWQFRWDTWGWSYVEHPDWSLDVCDFFLIIGPLQMRGMFSLDSNV